MILIVICLLLSANGFYTALSTFSDSAGFYGAITGASIWLVLAIVAIRYRKKLIKKEK